MTKAAKTPAYSADSLKVLRFPENIRKRPSMYVGGITSETGVFRLFREGFDNILDEAMNGHGTCAWVSYNTKTNVFVVCDRGRGIPTGMNKKEGKSSIELAFTSMHGSGKFDQANYTASAGMNGIGLKAVAALSEYVSAYSANEGVWKSLHLKRGIVQGAVKKEKPNYAWAKKISGTIIEWKPDTKIFGTEVISVERMHRELRYATMLNPGFSVEFVVDGKSTTYVSENGLLDMVYGTEEQKQQALVKPFQFLDKKKIDIALVWHDDDLQETWSFVNSSNTPEEGTHVQGARAAVLEALREEMTTAVKTVKSKSAKSKKTKDDNVDAKYLLMGMRMAINWRMVDPMFSGQTKDKLTSSEAVTAVKNIVLPEFSGFLKKNPKLINTLIDRARKFQQASEKFQQDLKAVKSIKLADPTSRGILPGKLTQAHGYKPDDKELILVEGDSAESGCKKARMPWQEILPLRGKLPNPIRTATAKFMSNEEVLGIFTAVGVLPGESYDSKKRRIGRIGFLPDADPDGKHINSELIAFATKYLPDFLAKGKIFYINSPLFVGSLRGTKKYANTTEELLALFPEKDRKSVLVTRMKGWAEASAEDLKTIAMDPTTRSIVQLSSSDKDAGIVTSVMGEDGAFRKEMLGIKEGEV
jgi:DNA gyrase/topoisomerase IV subunit B